MTKFKLLSILYSSLFFAIIFLFPFSSASADISTGLTAHYKLDETSGTTVADSSGNGKNGTITGATWTTGKLNNALSFNGTSNYASVPRMNYDEITVSAWFYKTANDTLSNADVIWGGWRWATDTQLQEGFDLRFFGAGATQLAFIVVTTDGVTKIQKSSYHTFTNTLDGWHHAVGTYNKTTGEQKLYVDGVLRDTDLHVISNTIVPLANYTDMRIGYSRVNNGYFPGLLDEVRVYSRALSSADITELYNYTGSGTSSSSAQSSSSSVQSAPTATTNTATNITSTSATLNATVNNNGLTTTAYFQYGLTTAYGNTSPTQTVSSL
ncbi:MAG: hypothetical protein HW401_172, partial [Parcubacteria group bacterium]|nr:hypothetical protein [Parcubacteria group bacterium]